MPPSAPLQTCHPGPCSHVLLPRKWSDLSRAVPLAASAWPAMRKRFQAVLFSLAIASALLPSRGRTGLIQYDFFNFPDVQQGYTVAGHLSVDSSHVPAQSAGFVPLGSRSITPPSWPPSPLPRISISRDTDGMMMEMNSK